MINTSRSAIAILFALLAAVPLVGDPGEVRLIGDLNTGVDNDGWSSPTHFAALGDLTLFAASDSAHGRELWVTDGTAQGTSLVLDIAPGWHRSSNPKGLVTFDGKVYFSATNYSYGNELWSSDGTAEGTALVADLWPGAAQGGNPSWLTVSGDTLFFVANTPDYGYELWKIPAGGSPQLAADLRTGPLSSFPQGLTAATNQLLFSYSTPETGRELARYNLLNEQVTVWDIEPGSASSDPEMLSTDGGYFLSAETSDVGRELRRLSGIPAEVCLVVDVYPGIEDSDPQEVAKIGGDVVFTAKNASSGNEHWVWRTGAFCPGTLTSLEQVDANALTVYGGEVLFESDGDLWKTDGTAANTTLIDTPDIQGYWNDRQNVYLMAWDGWIWFVGDGGIWRSDGTAGNTSLRWNCNGCSPSAFNWWQTGADGIYASLDDGFTGAEPYRYTSTTSSQLKDIHRDVGYSEPREFSAVGDRVYFAARTDAEGDELLTWDGGSGDATLVEDLRAGPTGSYPQGLWSVGSKLYFSADDGTDEGLWSVESDSVSLVMSLSNVLPLGSLGNQLLFRADDISGDEQVWVTTGVGATQISSFPPDSRVEVPSSTGFAVEAGGQLYFAVDESVHGNELWSSDGVSADIVVDLDPGPASGGGDDRVAHDGLVLFSGTNGAQSGLWSTDGTPQNTDLVAEMTAYPLFSVGPVAAFWGFDEALGTELWGTDGTPGSTILLADINPGPATGGFLYSYANWGVSGGKAYFQAVQLDTGVELWVTDGTPAGTHLVRDIAPGPASSVPWFITPLPNGDVVFAAWSPETGIELWRSNGTSTGTYRVTDVAPGPESSVPVYPVVAGDWVVFRAYSEATGMEPWAYDWTGEPFLFGDGFESGDTTAW